MQARAELTAPRLTALARLDDAGFRAFFSGSPIKRIGRDRFLRNVLIALGNSGREEMAGEVESHLDDPSPLVRGTAVWALSRLLPKERFLQVAEPLSRGEQDASVQQELSFAASSM